MRKTAAIAALAAAAGALALPAYAEQDSTYYGTSRFHRALPADNMVHTAALNAADQELADRVADALSRDKAINNAPVTVAVNHGDVTLSGPTDNQQIATRIEDVAASVAGRGHVFPMV
ncbi:MAG TPA: BON domain-containing protein [Usitatibacter sp.]|nr:BON domain-containing protein [Usitatibacter sp.]